MFWLLTESLPADFYDFLVLRYGFPLYPPSENGKSDFSYFKKEQDFAASCRTTFNRIFLSILYKNGNNAALQTKEVPDKATACTQLKRRVNLQWL